jgi:hypothetical protein
MKVKKLIKKLYKAIVLHNLKRERKIYKKITKKSLKHKHTEAIQ